MSPFQRAGEALARNLADEGKCYEAWYLRGVLDALAGLGANDEGGLYNGDYREGYEAIVGSGGAGAAEGAEG